MPFSRILNRVLSYTEYGPEYHIDNQKVTKLPAVVDKIQQNDKTSLCLWYSNESNAEQYYLNLYWNTHLVQNRKETCISDEIY